MATTLDEGLRRCETLTVFAIVALAAAVLGQAAPAGAPPSWRKGAPSSPASRPPWDGPVLATPSHADVDQAEVDQARRDMR